MRKRCLQSQSRNPFVPDELILDYDIPIEENAGRPGVLILSSLQTGFPVKFKV